MNMRLFQEIFELNQAFERVIEGLKRMEKVALFPVDVPREKRAEVVLVQVDCNRQFSDKFHKVFKKDEGWASAIIRACGAQRIDPNDAYLEIRRRKREAEDANQVAAPTGSRIPNLHRANIAHQRVRMEGWRQRRLG